VDLHETADGARCIRIQHATLEGVTPKMLAWWYGHVEGDMEYADAMWPRYLVWHPLDHISYSANPRSTGTAVVPGTRLHVREAFQHDPENLLDIHIVVERLDEREAIIAKHVAGRGVLRLLNRFEAVSGGTRYTSEMKIGLDVPNGYARRLANAVLRRRILPGEMAMRWARHHVEEIGNLENFLPGLFQNHGKT
jgi:hypothetical protein